MPGDDWPLLRLRGREGDPVAVTELSLGGHDLLQYFPIAVELKASARSVTTATITFEVSPDIEIPVELTPPPAKLLEQVQVTRLELTTDDVALVRVPYRINQAVEAQIRRQVLDRLPGLADVMVLDAGASFDIFTPAEDTDSPEPTSPPVGRPSHRTPAEADAAAGALMGVLHEVDDPEVCDLILTRAVQWEAEAAYLRSLHNSETES